jgi:hypothetical protein
MTIDFGDIDFRQETDYHDGMAIKQDPFSAAYALGLLGNPQTSTLIEKELRKKLPIQGAKGIMPMASPRTLSSAAMALFGAS